MNLTYFSLLVDKKRYIITKLDKLIKKKISPYK